eukprot:SAG25_NODE_481_length_7507_cov_80.752160_4_plen_43_part_00
MNHFNETQGNFQTLYCMKKFKCPKSVIGWCLYERTKPFGAGV